jgi:hypothetical protein
MSKFKIQGSSSNEDYTVTLTDSGGSVNQTLTLPDSSGVILNDQSNLNATKLAGELLSANLTTASGDDDRVLTANSAGDLSFAVPSSPLSYLTGVLGQVSTPGTTRTGTYTNNTSSSIDLLVYCYAGSASGACSLQNTRAGAGGYGGLSIGQMTLEAGTSVQYEIGAGGTAQTVDGSSGSSGGNTTFGVGNNYPDIISASTGAGGSVPANWLSSGAQGAGGGPLVGLPGGQGTVAGNDASSEAGRDGFIGLFAATLPSSF